MKAYIVMAGDPHEEMPVSVFLNKEEADALKSQLDLCGGADVVEWDVGNAYAGQEPLCIWVAHVHKSNGQFSHHYEVWEMKKASDWHDYNYDDNDKYTIFVTRRSISSLEDAKEKAIFAYHARSIPDYEN